MNAASQWSTIGWMVLCGALMGLVFDFYRVIARRFHIPRWMLPAFDVVYWAAATLGVFNVLLDHNHGEVRLYVFLGLGIGVTGYFGLLSPHVVKAADRIVTLVIGLAAWLWKAFRLVIAVPFLFLVRILAKLLDIVFVIIAAILLYVGKLLLIPLMPLWNWLWDKLLPVRRRVTAGIEGWKRLKNRIKAAWETFWKKS
ncbi:spore cortex biosynthesis protein YabQ [Cohnella candidum]|uniref:Spore cortex biosynthesis protein YabQ n=1 Tax=Cohnella candidum TaxID=2674991 RepID=A0A3G3K2F6_9BACL|nr:spore cortex biosynthesis protein YabQ [Cohnella candidum]AYQ74622.1 spore cortex biosynthesis protein YabQ [Cohnella candidum]